MLGAIYIGLSGMNAYGRGLQTISNNVVNLNSTGFKGSTTGFNDVFSYGTGGVTSFRSLDSSLTGSGVRYSDARVDFGQGDLRQSDGELDLAIQGSGFLVLDRAGQSFYARTGQFTVDKDGYVVLQGTDYRLTVLDTAGKPRAVNLDAHKISAPVASTSVKFSDNLSSGASTHSVGNIQIYDSRGGVQNWTAEFTKIPGGTGNVEEWDIKVSDGTGTELKTQRLKFIGGILDTTTSKFTVTATPTGADPLSVEMDFSSGVTSFSQGTSSTLKAATVDGSAAGTFSSVTIDSDGAVKITYSNTKTELLGSVAIADFRDPQQLQRIGGGVFENIGNAPTRILTSAKDGIGRLLSKQLEASNVDLSQEFGDLILIQRGYQASSQVVSVANDMIQQLFGIRGQG